MGSTDIEWTAESDGRKGHSWNPGIYGCDPDGPECHNCYAEIMAHRQVAMGNYPAGITKKTRAGVKWTGLVLTDMKRGLAGFENLPTKREAFVFTTSMADIAHDDVPFEHLAWMFELIRTRPNLTFLLLTKRPGQLADFVEHAHRNLYAFPGTAQHRHWFWPRNAWVGTTIGTQSNVERRGRELLRLRDAPVRFVSAEPLLERINLDPLLGMECVHEDAYVEPDTNAVVCRECDESAIVDWVIAGGESGRKARPMHPDWVRALRDDCQRASVSFFFKQWGEFVEVNPDRRGPDGDHVVLDPDAPDDCGTWVQGQSVGVTSRGAVVDDLEDMEPGVEYRHMQRVGKHESGRLLDGRIWADRPARAA